VAAEQLTDSKLDALIGSAEFGVRKLLEAMGDDPDREGLTDTPARVVRAMREMTAGLLLDPADVLGTTFDVQSDEMVVVTGIEFVSLCEHHLLPFTGTAAIGYLPDQRVVGLSKLARLVDLYARRPQVQERMTRQITDALDAHLPSKGSACVLRATHSCMSCRGVRKVARMVTSSLTGAFRAEPETRGEFLSLAHGG
jgi:GTP cyclohydrolase I